MADHRLFTLAPDMKVYSVIPEALGNAGRMRMRTGYCGNISPRGSTSQNIAIQAQCDRARLNERPRKTLHYEAPAQRFHAAVASTGWIRREERT